jgi:hypothetical protein
VFRKYANPFPRRPLADGREFLVIATGRDDADDDPSSWDFRAALPLDDRPTGGVAPVYSVDGTAPTGREAVLSAARAAVAAGSPPGWDRPAYIRLRAKAPREPATMLRVPCDGRTKALALRWATSGDTDQRLYAARLLGRFDSPETIAALRQLLADNWIELRVTGNGTREVYPVRLAAFQSLRQLKAPDVTEPQIDATPWPLTFAAEHAVGLTVVAALLVAPVAVQAWVRRRRRKRGSFVERFSIPRAAFGALALGSAVLGVIFGYYWTASHDQGALFSHLHETGRARLAMSVAGKLQMATVEGLGQGYTTGVWTTCPDNLENRLNDPDVKVKQGAWGFVYARAERDARSTEQMTFVQAPYWALLAAAAVLPAIWAVRQVGFARRRRRAATGRCVACGYDLRHTPERCPECGRDVPEALRRFIPGETLGSGSR